MADQSGAEPRGGAAQQSAAPKRAGSKQASVDRVERQEGAPEGAPRAVSRWKGAQPGPDVSNAELDLGTVSPVAEHSTYHANPDPNPDNLRPAPGPSSVQVLGTADSIQEQGDDDEALANKGEENR